MILKGIETKKLLEKKKFFKELEMFSRFGARRLETMIYYFEELQYSKNNFVFKEGD